MVEMDIYALEYGRYALEMSWRRQNSAEINIKLSEESYPAHHS